MPKRSKANPRNHRSKRSRPQSPGICLHQKWKDHLCQTVLESSRKSSLTVKALARRRRERVSQQCRSCFRKKRRIGSWSSLRKRNVRRNSSNTTGHQLSGKQTPLRSSLVMYLKAFKHQQATPYRLSNSRKQWTTTLIIPVTRDSLQIAQWIPQDDRDSLRSREIINGTTGTVTRLTWLSSKEIPSLSVMDTWLLWIQHRQGKDMHLISSIERILSYSKMKKMKL